MVSSHATLKIKKDVNGNIKRKGGIVVHGTGDADRDRVRSDCAATDMEVIRMLHSSV